MPAAAGGCAGPPSTSLVLDQFGRNLTAGRREGKLDPVIGREKEIERVMQVLAAHQEQPGAHRRAGRRQRPPVVEGLAQAIVNGEVPETPAPEATSSSTPSTSGRWWPAVRYRGDFEERLEEGPSEIRTRGRHHPVHRRVVHTSRRCRGPRVRSTPPSILKPAGPRRAADHRRTTLDEYRNIEKDAAPSAGSSRSGR